MVEIGRRQICKAAFESGIDDLFIKLFEKVKDGSGEVQLFSLNDARARNRKKRIHLSQLRLLPGLHTYPNTYHVFSLPSCITKYVGYNIDRFTSPS
jgi:hypothetical protein